MFAAHCSYSGRGKETRLDEGEKCTKVTDLLSRSGSAAVVIDRVPTRWKSKLLLAV